MDVFDLFAKIAIDTSEYDKGLDDAASKSQSFGAALSSGVAGVAAGAAVAIGTVTAATTALAGGIVSGSREVAEYGDHIDKMSQKMGISAEAFQEWDAVMQHSGTSIEALKPSMKTLALAAEKGSDAFEKLGISQEEVSQLSQEDLFAKVITGLQQMEEGTERTYITSQLLGRGATELGALLNTSAEDTQKMRDRVHELGGVMSDEAVKAAAAFQDSLQDMQTGFDGLKRGLFSEFLPAITTVMDGLGNVFSGDTTKGLDQISDGIDSFVTGITDKLPEVLDVAVEIISALAEAIINNLPKLMQAGAAALGKLVEVIIANLPKLMEAGIQIVAQIATSIGEALPEMIPAIVEMILTIAEVLIDNIDLLMDASVALITGLAEGLIAALPILLEKAPELIQKLVDATIECTPMLVDLALQLITALAQGILDNLPLIADAAIQIIGTLIAGSLEMIPALVDMAGQLVGAIADFFLNTDSAQWGIDLIQGLIDGILSMLDKVGDAVGSVAEKIASYIHFSEPDVGPLANFHTFAPDMMDLFAKGIRDNEGMLQKQVASSFDLRPAMGEISAAGYAGAGSTGSGYGQGQQPQQMTVILELDKTQLAKTVYQLNNSETQRVGTRLVYV